MERTPSEQRSPASTVIVIPCYNEAERLRVDDFVEYAAKRSWLRLFFVDDGSSDATRERIAAVERQTPQNICCLTLDSNKGKAEAVRHGVLAALETAPDLVGYWDADLATPLVEIDRFRALFERTSELQIAIGSRVKLLGRRIERSETRHYFGRIAATLVSGILGVPVYDTQCGAKLFRADALLARVFAEPFVTRWIFDVEILARWLIERPPQAVVERSLVEVPLHQWIDVPGSKIQWVDILTAPLGLWHVWRHYGHLLRERARRDSTLDASGAG